MQTLILTPSSPEWMHALNSVRYDVYQLPQYAHLEAERCHAKAEAILIREGEKFLLVPYLLRCCNEVFLQEHPGEQIYDAISPYGYSGIIFSHSATRDPLFADRSLAKFAKVLRDRAVCSVFLRLHPILHASYPDLLPSETFTVTGETVSIDLREDDLWSPTRRGHRSTINKCKRIGMKAEMVPAAQSIDDFCNIYQETMDRVGAIKDYNEFDLKYFRRICEVLSEYAHICLVNFEGQSISVGLYFECGGIVQSAFGGTRNGFIRLSPSSLETDFARYWSQERGNEFMHLGGGVGASNRDGVFKFKAGFSKLRHKFHTIRKILDEDKYYMLSRTRAKMIGCTVSELEEKGFFPCYRTPIELIDSVKF